MAGNSPAGRVRPAFETALLAASVAALALPQAGTCVALLAILALWIAVKPPRQELFFVAVALGLVVVLIFGSLLAGRLPPPRIEDWSDEIETGFLAVWRDLRATARQAAASFETMPERGGDHRAEFDRLAALADGNGKGESTTFLLLAPGGETVAWAGEGLRHEVVPADLPRSGFAFKRGYTASTIFAVEALPGTPESAPPQAAWRLVAGRSLEADRLPFKIRGAAHFAPRWAFGSRDIPAPAGVIKLDLGDAPALFLSRPEDLESRLQSYAGGVYRLAVGLLGLTLLALALLRATGGRLLPESVLLRPWGVPVLALTGTVALGVAAWFEPPLIAALAAAVGLASWGLVRRRPSDLRAGGGLIAGALAALVPVVAAGLYQRFVGAEDLSSGFSSTADSVALCLVWCLLSLGLLTLTAVRRGPTAGDAPAWWAAALLTFAGALCDFPIFALPLLVATAP